MHLMMPTLKLSMYSAVMSSKTKASFQQRRRRAAAGLAPVNQDLAVVLCVSPSRILVTSDSRFLGYRMIICGLLEEGEEEDLEGAVL